MKNVRFSARTLMSAIMFIGINVAWMQGSSSQVAPVGLAASTPLSVPLAATSVANQSYQNTNPQEQRIYPGLNSALWMRWSAEYRASSTQAYRLAALQLEAALRAPQWTAALEQTGQYTKLPPAVIFDLDETLFDNSPYDAAMVEKGLDYDPTTFVQWNASGGIHALPGALEFAKDAARRGATLFYITNRSLKEKAVTIQNLHRLGFPIRSADHLLFKGGRPRNSTLEWTSDKTARRRFVAQNYRVLLLLGDDFNDFLSIPAHATVQQRLQLQSRYKNYWGSRWIILPNPHYGSWERSLVGEARGSAALHRKVAALILSPKL